MRLSFHNKPLLYSLILTSLATAILLCGVTISFSNVYFNWNQLSDKLGTEFNLMIGREITNTLILVVDVSILAAGYMMAKAHIQGLYLTFIFGIALTFTGVSRGDGFSIISGSMLFVALVFGLYGRSLVRGLHRDKSRTSEDIVKIVLVLSSSVGIMFLFGIFFYTAWRGSAYLTPTFIQDTWPGNFVVSRVLVGLENVVFGIKDQILGSLILTILTLFIAVPIGIGAAIYLQEYAPDNSLTRLIRLTMSTLAGAPSVVLGLFGYGLFVVALKWGNTLLGASIVLTIMVLPYIVSITSEAISVVPMSYKEASLALGATKWQTIRHALLPTAAPSIVTGVLLSFGKAFGETAAVWWVASTANSFTWPITLTGQAVPNIPVWMKEGYYNLFSFQVPGRGTWDGQNVIMAGASVLLLIYLAVSVASLIIRNNMRKKLEG